MSHESSSHVITHCQSAAPRMFPGGGCARRQAFFKLLQRMQILLLIVNNNIFGRVHIFCVQCVLQRNYNIYKTDLKKSDHGASKIPFHVVVRFKDVLGFNTSCCFAVASRIDFI
jgi:hypothetical protein